MLSEDTVIEHGIDYAIIAEQGSGRYLTDPLRYPAQVERYNRLLDEFCLVKSFGGLEPSTILAPCSSP